MVFVLAMVPATVPDGMEPPEVLAGRNPVLGSADCQFNVDGN